jgi:hypothetical protein
LRSSWLAAVALALLAPTAALAADTPPARAAPRIEARSSSLLAVGVVHADKMSIHISRLVDNAPLQDAVVTVVLRGTSHATLAETDGSYTLQSKDLTLPGAAAVQFLVSQGGSSESLKGTLDVAAPTGSSGEANNARQLWWWVLNFAVCFGVLWLISRRRKTAST